MTEKKVVWAIFDNRTGNRQQLTGVLNELNLGYEKLEIKYNRYAFLPNVIIQLIGGFLHIKNNINLDNIKNPHVLIACGRRTVPVALKVYKDLPYKPFLIQLMYPRFTLYKKLYDMIIVPEHDRTPKHKNIYKFIGTPNQISHLTKTEQSKILSKKKNSIILILLGGNHGKYKLNITLINKIINSVMISAEKNDCIYITTSRRTSLQGIKYIDKQFAKNKKIKQIYHPNTSSENNPIVNFLYECKEIVVTGDSMSMISEACSINKPVRIFYNKNICSPKQIAYCKKLIEEGYAFKLNSKKMIKKNIKVLETTKFISNKIKEVMLKKYE